MGEPAAEEQEEAAALWTQLGPDVETLQSSPDRGARRAALLQLQKALLVADGGHHPGTAAARAFFARRLQAPLLAVIGEDAVEKCRELGAALLVGLLDRPGFLPDEPEQQQDGEEDDAAGETPLLAAYLPVLRRRIVASSDGGAGGEGSEEVRLLLLRAINALLARRRCWPHALRHPVRGAAGQQGGREGGPFGDLAAVLASALADPYPEVKREACTAVGLVARHAPGQLRLHHSTLLKPVLGVLGHQHARIRTQGLQALGGLVAVGHDSMAVLMEEHVHPVLRRLVFDRTPSVRRELARVVGAWLHQAGAEDAGGGPYFFEACEPDLLLVLLLLLSDESSGEVATEARQQAVAAGRAWVARRRVRRHHPRLDLVQPDSGPEGMAMDLDLDTADEEGDADTDEGDDEAGLRRMVQALFARSLLPRALDYVGHWTLRMRHRAVLLLADLVALAGLDGPALASLPTLVATLLSTLVGDGAEAEVAAAVEHAARALARAVPPAAMLDELLPQVRGERGARAVHRGAALRLLRPCLLLLPAQATPMAPCPLSETEAAALARALADPGLMEDAAAVAGPLAAGLSAAAACLPSSCQRHLVRAALPLLALPPNQAPRAQALEVLALSHAQDEAEAEAEGHVPRLLRAHFAALLADVAAGAEMWDSPQAPGRVAWDALLRECPRGAAENWGLVGPILARQLRAPSSPSSDAGASDGRAELRLAHLLLLDALLRDPAFRAALAPEVGQGVVADLLQPSLVWRAGRAEATVRKAALMALHALLRGGEDRVQLGPSIGALLLPSLRTALEEYDATARELAALCVEGVLASSAGHENDEEEEEVVGRLLPDLLKRLDDPSENVRRAVCRALRALAPLLPVEQREGLETRSREEGEGEL